MRQCGQSGVGIGLVLLVMLGGALSCPHPVQAEEWVVDRDPPPVQAEEWVVDRDTAYRYLRRAEMAQQRNDWGPAVQDLTMAMTLYRMLLTDAPEWEQDYFRFRRETCERQLRVIEQRTGVSRDEWMERDSRSPGRESSYRDLYAALQIENEQLRRQIKRLEDEIELLLEMEELERDRLERHRQATMDTAPRPAQMESAVPVPPPALEEPVEEPQQVGPTIRGRRPLAR